MKVDSNYNFPYNLLKPSNKVILPSDLEEISGISFFQGDNVLACHNDEKGKIYLFDIENEKIIEDFKFDKDGDYEDIVVINDDAYIVRSDGKIFEVKNFTSKKRKVEEFNTPLSEKNDVEGLCFDGANNLLLLACKASPNLGDKKYKDSRAVYAFDLSEQKLIQEPHILIQIEDVDDTMKTSSYEEFSKKLAKNLSSAGDPSFQPSGIDIHPITKDIYILSSIGKKIVILNQEREIVAVAGIDKKLFPQPEGICFKSNGNMIISNEGKGGKGNLLEFIYQGDAKK